MVAEELRWFETESQEVLATLIRDRTDHDYSGILLARDAKERYRFVNMTEFFDSADAAVTALDRHSEMLLRDLDQERQQGDERGAPVDFLSAVVPMARLHPDFAKLANLEGYSPARQIIEPMMRWYEDTDGNFIEQFQTTGFDARIWELYLFAAFIEAGFEIDREAAVPDFACRGLLGELCVEATTVNPTRDATGAVIPPPPIDTDDEISAFQREYVPIKYGGPLTTKLAKRYWDLPNVKDKPLLLAIQDFHAPMSMNTTRAGLPIYLYGYDYDWHRHADGSVRIVPRKVKTHSWGAKTIPSCFFKLPGAENISAVIHNHSATISKFNRMGVLAGFGSKRVKLVREGLAFDPDPNAVEPKRFSKTVNDADYAESWIEGMDVFHNPWAKHPLDPSMLQGAAHHRLLDDGQLQSHPPEWQPLSSITIITVGEL